MHNTRTTLTSLDDNANHFGCGLSGVLRRSWKIKLALHDIVLRATPSTHWQQVVKCEAFYILTSKATGKIEEKDYININQHCYLLASCRKGTSSPKPEFTTD
jgi:hypothetical protein